MNSFVSAMAEDDVITMPAESTGEIFLVANKNFSIGDTVNMLDGEIFDVKTMHTIERFVGKHLLMNNLLVISVVFDLLPKIGHRSKTTSRERPKSAPYLRLKNSKRTSKCQVLSSTVPKKSFQKFFEFF